jgi:hypothetical protein
LANDSAVLTGDGDVLDRQIAYRVAPEDEDSPWFRFRKIGSGFVSPFNANNLGLLFAVFFI